MQACFAVNSKQVLLISGKRLSEDDLGGRPSLLPPLDTPLKKECSGYRFFNPIIASCQFLRIISHGLVAFLGSASKLSSSLWLCFIIHHHSHVSATRLKQEFWSVALLSWN
jgi:hypothetical protein